MNKAVALILWILVAVIGTTVYFYSQSAKDSGSAVITEGDGAGLQVENGKAYMDVKWEHLQDVPRFQMTNQLGNTFDSANVAGRPMVVSFFFATCPTICRDLNKQISELRSQLNDQEMMFTTISVDPEKDTPEVLERYARDFDATPEDWNFLTGPLYKVQQLGNQAFNVSVDPDTHTDNILLVDRWGRFRDRFKWDDPFDMKRFLKVAKDVLAEQNPPFGEMIHTRNVMAGIEPGDVNSVKWIREFHLVDQDTNKFFSRDLTGQVWIANFFFVACPGICVEQNQYIAGLQQRLKDRPVELVSISTSPNSDTPARLKKYSQKIGADLANWRFLTGNDTLIERTGAEFFKAYSSGGHHSTMLFVVDKWGNVRGEFDWREPAAEIKLLELVDALNSEEVPVGSFERISVEKEPDADDPNAGH